MDRRQPKFKSFKIHERVWCPYIYLEVTFYFVVIRPTFSVLEAYVISFVICSTHLGSHSGQGWPLHYGVFLTAVMANARLSLSSGHDLVLRIQQFHKVIDRTSRSSK
jgi:hypothetical protein